MDTIHIFAIGEVLKISLIDGGDTLAVQLRDTAGDEVAILVAVPLAEGLSEQVQAVLRDAASRPRLHWASADAAGRLPCAAIVDAPVAGLIPGLAGA